MARSLVRRAEGPSEELQEAAAGSSVGDSRPLDQERIDQSQAEEGKTQSRDSMVSVMVQHMDQLTEGHRVLVGCSLRHMDRHIVLALLLGISIGSAPGTG
jgi:hypothetical protein